VWSVSSRHSTPRNPAERGWGCQSVGLSSMRMAVGCGRRRTSLAALYFSSSCPARIETLRRFTGLEDLVKTSFQKLFINRLAKVTNNSVIQRLLPVCIIGVGCHEDCWNRAIDKLSVELDAGHHRHVDVGDQAVSFGKTRGCEEIAGR